MKAVKLLTINKEIIHAHGGGIFKLNDTYYLYGENRNENIFVSMYKSKDLKHFEFCNNILTTNSLELSINPQYKLGLKVKGRKVNIERPKIFYSEILKKYVLWAHYENGLDYSEAACCLATCDKIDGDYVYHGHFRPLSNMSRDLTIFVDDDNKKYLISASNDNKDLHLYLLNEDGLGVNKLVNVLFSSRLREAPAMFKHNNTYYLLTSFCTGWFPNQCKYATSTSLEGSFSKLKNIGNKTTSHSQPAFILTRGDSFIYVGDRWGGNGWKSTDEFVYNNSTYTYCYLALKNGKLMFSNKKVKLDE